MSVLDEWIGKAEDDYKAAVALNRRRREPLPDIVCYHCQQSAEKYLKAYLISRSVVPPWTHDLADLLALCQGYDPTLSVLDPQAQYLRRYAVLIRYPGLAATVADARDALLALRRIRRVLRKKLGL